MSIRITDAEMTAETTGHRAVRRDDGRWTVTTHPGRPMDRNSAITALTIAEERAADHPRAVLIEALEQELRDVLEGGRR